VSFNSLQYLLFLPIVTLVYFSLEKQNYRILFLVIASYFFYMCWNPVYIILILVSTLVDFYISQSISNSRSEKLKLHLLFLSLSMNLGILFYFKYYNFLAFNIEELCSLMNFSINIPENNLLLPVGISFYTFQTLGYTIDVYNEEIEAESDFFSFALYVSFFPQLVAGPIERAKSLLPQLKRKYSFDYVKAVDGMRLILIGLFKKIVIADRLAFYVDTVFAEPSAYNGMSIWLASMFFLFQIYCDFSGYSDIAIGTAKLFGVDLMENFKGPIFSRSVTEFWRRWHISLSTWFRDYVYTPVAFSARKLGRYSYIFPILISFTLIGLWHGANYTFILFGVLHSAALIFEMSTNNFRRKLFDPLNQSFVIFLGLTTTFIFCVYTSLIFRAENLSHVLELSKSLLVFDKPMLLSSLTKGSEVFDVYTCYFLILIVLLINFVEFNEGFISLFRKLIRPARWAFYIILVLVICTLGVFNSYQEFIYFQF